MKNTALATLHRQFIFEATLLVVFCSIPLLAVAENAAEKQPPAAEIVKGATETYVSSLKVPRPATASGEIPKQCWSAAIRALKPLKVYTHLVNVVVVQRMEGEQEEGLYIHIPISSYLPMDGVHGFALTPKPNTGDTYTLGTGVFSYQRRTTNQGGAANRSQPVGAPTNRTSSAAGSGR